MLGPLIEATGAAPQVELADPGSAEDGEQDVTLAWTWTLPDEAGTWEYTTQATLRRGEDGWASDLGPDLCPPTSRRASTWTSQPWTRRSARSPIAMAACSTANAR